MWTLSGLRGAPVPAPSARAGTPRSAPAFPLVAAASPGPGVAAPGARPPAVTAQWSCRPRPPSLSCPPGPSCGSCTCCVCPPPPAIVGPRGCPLWLRPPYGPQWGLPSCFCQENLPASTLALSALPGAPPARPHLWAHLTPCHVLLVMFIPPTPRVGSWALGSLLPSGGQASPPRPPRCPACLHLRGLSTVSC